MDTNFAYFEEYTKSLLGLQHIFVSLVKSVDYHCIVTLAMSITAGAIRTISSKPLEVGCK